MNYKILLWLYIINTVFLINHETDSAYWHEWDLFKMKGGITVFLIIHFPMWILVLMGLLEVYQGTFIGLVSSVILSSVGIFAFCIHTYFIKKGNKEFTTPISRFILISTLLISVVQMAVTVNLLMV